MNIFLNLIFTKCLCFVMKEFFKYFFRLKLSFKNDGFNLTAMHLMNRLAIIIGFSGILYVFFKYLL